MLQQVLIEVLKGIGLFFLHPLFYYFLIVALIFGLRRIKAERAHFNVSINRLLVDMKYFFLKGLLLSLLMSLIIVFIKITIPLAALIIFACFYILLSFICKARFLTPVYVIGLSFFTLLFIVNFISFADPVLNSLFSSINGPTFQSLALLLVLLMFGEGLLLLKDGGEDSSPRIVKSKRGLNIGSQVINRLTLIPLLIIVPTDFLLEGFQWLPAVTVGGKVYSFLIIPFAIGTSQKNEGILPVTSACTVGNQLIMASLISYLIVVGSYYVNDLAIVAVAFALLAREFINYRHRKRDASLPAYFTNSSKGLTILAVLPNSPAEKMGLKIGERIFKVNGVTVEDEFSFYRAIQINSAHCKLEVVDSQDEVRFVQSALYTDDNHRLGILFVN